MKASLKEELVCTDAKIYASVAGKMSAERLRDYLGRYRQASIATLDAEIKRFLGSHWAVTALSFGNCTISVVKDGKEVFGQNIYFSYDTTVHGLEDKFEVSVGSTGSFENEGVIIGSRSRFYIDLGKLLSNDTEMMEIEEFLVAFHSATNGLMDLIRETEKENK